MKTHSSRRDFLLDLAASPLALAGLALAANTAAAAAWPKALFDSPTMTDAGRALNAPKPADGKQILLDVPEIADHDDRVTVRVLSTIPNTDQITLLVDKALRPVVAQFNLSSEALPEVSTVVKLPATSTLRVIVRAGTTFYSVDKEVKLANEPWTGTPEAAPHPAKPHKGKPA